MLSEAEKLDVLTVLGIELNQVQDLDILMEKILTEARRFVNADAGSIYIREGDELHFNYTQNDTLQKRCSPGEKLIYSIFSIPVDETSIAGYVAATGRPLNLPDVYAIDSSKPYHFGRKFDEASHYVTRSALTLPLKSAKGNVIGVLQIINARDEAGHFVAFSDKDERMMMHFASIAAVALKRAQMTRAMILRMIRMAEMRDPKETGAHVNRVGGYAIEIYEKWARKQGYDTREIEKNRDIFRMAAMLHDVGKIAISDQILKKPGRFNAAEYEIMKQHTVLGAQLFQDRQSDFDDMAAQVALNHHEWWNGEGYPGHIDTDRGHRLGETGFPVQRPNGKKGNEIPIYGRVVSLVDVYDALCSARVYKEAWEEAKVLSTIEAGAGTQFDPELVEIFFNTLDMIRSIQLRYQDKAEPPGE
ncbi:MAG: GAF and HD-GYP domain-containing protein [Thermodesulfobacteriota bacterium]